MSVYCCTVFDSTVSVSCWCGRWLSLVTRLHARTMADQKVELKRTMSVFSGCAYIIGTIVGSGIFVSPKGVVIESGSVGAALVVWAMCGIVVLLGAICYAELGTIIPRTGGPYEYIREAFGDFPAFVYCWAIVMIVLPTGNAVIALTFAYYTIQPFFPDCTSPNVAVVVLAATALGETRHCYSPLIDVIIIILLLVPSSVNGHGVDCSVCFSHAHIREWI